MISVGMDVSKGKSIVCIASRASRVREPFQVSHTEEGLEGLCAQLTELSARHQVRVVMEATGIYHLPVLLHLQQAGLFVSVVNPLLMKKFAAQTIRKNKNDKLDAIKIAAYGLEKWEQLKPFTPTQQVYEELRLLGRQYTHYITLKIKCKQNLSCLLERTMPGISTLISANHTGTGGKDKLLDFVDTYWHYHNITAMGENAFVADYARWARQYGYHPSEKKARAIFQAAQRSVATLPATTPCCHLLIKQALRSLREISQVAVEILMEMQQLAVTLPEYATVRAMDAVGDVLAVRLIAEIGDVRRFHSAKALIAYAGIDSPEFQSGSFSANQRHISKRGSSLLRKTGYEVMQSLMRLHCTQSPVYQYILKKEAEGKPKKVAKIAGLNKFLRIYYAKVQQSYRFMERTRTYPIAC